MMRAFATGALLATAQACHVGHCLLDPMETTTPTRELGQALYAPCMDTTVCSEATMDLILDIYELGDGSDTATEAQMNRWKAVNAGAPWADPGPNTYLETCEVVDCGTGPWANDEACDPLCTFATGVGDAPNTCVPTVTDCTTGFVPGDSTCPSSTCPSGCVHTAATKPSTKCQNCINMATVPDYQCDSPPPPECAAIDFGVGGPFNCCLCAQDQDLCPMECMTAPIACVGILKCPGFCPGEESRLEEEATAIFDADCSTGDSPACDTTDRARMLEIWQLPDVPATCASMSRDDTFGMDMMQAIGCASEAECETKMATMMTGGAVELADADKAMCMACIQGEFEEWWMTSVTDYDCDSPPAECAGFLENFENGAKDCCACYPDEHVDDCPAACKLLPLACKGAPKCSECAVEEDEEPDKTSDAILPTIAFAALAAVAALN